MITRMNASPSVSGTNRKWYSAVTANCSRDRSTSSSVSMGAPGRVVRLGVGRVDQAFCNAVGIGAHRAAIEKRIEKRHDQQELDDDGQRDFPGEWVLQERERGLSHGCSLFARAVPALHQERDIFLLMFQKDRPRIREG